MTIETEADTRANRIDPVLREAGWDVVEGSRIQREMICPGRITGGGGRANPLSADYVLSCRDQKLAVIEAKRAGLGTPTASARPRTTPAASRPASPTRRTASAGTASTWTPGRRATHAPPFPSPQDLWQRCFPDGNDWRDRFGAVHFETGGGKWEPRYYQHNAITAVLEAVARGRSRILLTLATGTGKTSIAFQIAWKLFQSSWNLSREPVRRPRILFLADRNILADQAYNAFSAFPPDALARISPDEIRKLGRVPKNASVFFTIFQTFMTGEGEFTFQGYEHFNDPEWDSDPLPPDGPPGPRPPGEPPGRSPQILTDPEPTVTEKIVVKLADGKERQIRYIASTSYWSHDGRPITAQEFMEQLFGDLGTLVASEDELRAVWSDPERRNAFILRLTEMGYDADRLEDMQRLIDAPDSDIFDVLAYVRFTLAPLARTERSEQARRTGLSGYEDEMRSFLDYVLRGYEAHGTDELALTKISDLLRIRYGGTNEAKQRLGTVADIRAAFVNIQRHLFQ
ncbi:DEAD/DEAH box helicase family protein [Rhodobacteraceae bacterium MCCB 386]|nr:type I restriction endonuclease subunit R [Roseitranquillus sediminis]MBM9593437.1 DEAD/DEAH box helicase family protein [Roseitranquillus sediminis]